MLLGKCELYLILLIVGAKFAAPCRGLCAATRTSENWKINGRTIPILQSLFRKQNNSVSIKNGLYLIIHQK